MKASVKANAGVASLVLVAALIVVGGCSITPSSNIPGFLTSDNITQIIVTNNHTGQKGVASKQADDLNVLLNLLNIGDLKTSGRTVMAQPTAPAYTLVTYSNSTVVWTLLVLDTPTSSQVYIGDAVHPANSGGYTVSQAIKSSDLDQFISQNPYH